MQKVQLRYFLLMMLTGAFLLIPSEDVSAQCGLPGTPACKKKAATKPRAKTPARTSSGNTTVKPVTTAPPRVVYRPVTPIVAEKVKCYSPDLVYTVITCPDEVRYTYLATDRDRGFDMAVVQFDNVLLRLQPKDPFSYGVKCVSSYDRTIEMPCEGSFLKRGSSLVLLSRTKTLDWINVIDLDSGKEGWVYTGHVDIYFTRNPKTDSDSFIAEPSENFSDPEVTVKNSSDRVMTLKLGRSTYTIPSYTERTIVLTPGVYKYHGAFPRVFPVIGESTFSRGYRYTWTFTVVRINP